MIINKEKKKLKELHCLFKISLIVILLILTGCNSQDKWNIKQDEFEKTESFNYSEYVSGELDSTDKANLEQRKKNKFKEKEKIPEKTADKPSKSTSIFESIWGGINNLYKRFINLF